MTKATKLSHIDQDLDPTANPTFASPTDPGHAAIQSYVDDRALQTTPGTEQALGTGDSPTFAGWGTTLGAVLTSGGVGVPPSFVSQEGMIVNTGFGSSGTQSYVTAIYSRTSPKDVGLNAVITPKYNNSDFLIIAVGGFYNQFSTSSIYFDLGRSGTDVTDADSISGQVTGISSVERGIDIYVPMTAMYRDVNPQNSTGNKSPITYKSQSWPSGGTGYWNLPAGITSMFIFELRQ